jgi:hypothetical protein
MKAGYVYFSNKNSDFDSTINEVQTNFNIQNKLFDKQPTRKTATSPFSSGNRPNRPHFDLFY